MTARFTTHEAGGLPLLAARSPDGTFHLNRVKKAFRSPHSVSNVDAGNFAVKRYSTLGLS